MWCCEEILTALRSYFIMRSNTVKESPPYE